MTIRGARRRLTAGEVLWHREAGVKLERLEVAATLAVIERGRLGVRKNDGPRSTEIFRYVPSMVVGDTALMNLIDGEDRRRTACVYALEENTVVREYPPTTVREHVLARDFRMPLALLRTLLAHAAVNFLRLLYRNEKDQVVTDAATVGLHLVRQQTESISLARLDRCSWEDFTRLFTLAFQHREYSREIYKSLNRCRTNAGIRKATEYFEALFARRGETAFPERIATLVDASLAEVIDIRAHMRGAAGSQEKL